MFHHFVKDLRKYVSNYSAGIILENMFQTAGIILENMFQTAGIKHTCNC